MRQLKMWSSVLLVGVLIMCTLGIHVHADKAEGAEEKVYSEATLEDEFAEDRVMVVLNNSASLAIDQIDTNSFAGISCNQIKNLSKAKEAVVQEKLCSISAELEGIATARNKMEIVTTENIMKVATMDEELSSYHQVLCIELEESGKDKVLEVIAELEKRDDIIYAGPDYVISACATTPDDTSYVQQWAPEMIDLPGAWDITTGTSSVYVAVLDTGIDSTHTDLWQNIDTTLSRDFTNGYEGYIQRPVDYNGHGTAVAGVIGAGGDNGRGVAGACWNVRLVSLQILNSAGKGYSSNAALAIDFADSHNIPIINFSVGWYDDDDNSNDMTEQSLRYDYALYTVINNYSGLFVCAAGNSTLDNDEVDFLPSNYRLPNLISVGASDENDCRAYFSNYGYDTVDIFAPGSNIYTTTLNGGYTSMSGTSFAAPYVAGVAALLLSKYPYLTAEELKLSILRNAESVYNVNGSDVFYNYCTSGGRLNAYDTLMNRVHTHTYSHVSVGVTEGHDCVCTVCGYSIRESHRWSTSGFIHRCVLCGLESTYRPYGSDDVVSE